MKKTEAMAEDALSIIEDEARAVAVCYGAQWCDEAAATLIRRLVTRLGGVQVYVPRQSLAERKARDESVRARFNGCNVRELARDFGTSERTIRRILQGPIEGQG